METTALYEMWRETQQFTSDSGATYSVSFYQSYAGWRARAGRNGQCESLVAETALQTTRDGAAIEVAEMIEARERVNRKYGLI